MLKSALTLQLHPTHLRREQGHRSIGYSRLYLRSFAALRMTIFAQDDSFNLLYRLMSVLVELSCASSGSLVLSSSGMIRLASTLPSSTPHWSNELIFQMVPWTKTLCSYSAMSLPRVSGVSRSARIVFVGRLPSKVRCGT